MRGSGENAHPPVRFFQVLPLWGEKMLLNADVSSLVSLPIMDAVRRTYRLTTPRTLHHWGNGLGMELSAKKTELRRRRGLLITPDGTVKPRAGARFLGDLGSSCCFVYSAYRLRFHLSLHFLGNLFQLPPAPVTSACGSLAVRTHSPGPCC